MARTARAARSATRGVRAPNLHSPSASPRSSRSTPSYVNLVIRFGGVVVSGRVESPMPAWSSEVGGALTIQQVDALTALVESWADEAAAARRPEVPNTAGSGAAGLQRRRLRGLPRRRPGRAGGRLPQPAEHRQRACHRPADADQPAGPARGRLRGRPAQRCSSSGSATRARTTTTARPPACQPTRRPASATAALQALITFLLEQKQ